MRFHNSDPGAGSPAKRIRRVILGALLGSACSGTTGGDPPAPIVVVSVPPLAFLVDQIAAGLVETVVMVPPGANPATHEPSLLELRAAERAQLYVAVGHPRFPFEATWLLPLAGSRQVVSVADASDVDGDPHLWLVASHYAATAERIAEALAGLMPAHRDEFMARAGAVRNVIEETDGRVHARLAPFRGGSFLVFHSAWSRFAREYGLHERALEQGGKEPSARDVQEIISWARTTNVRVVFAQPQFAVASARTVAQEIGGRVEQLDPLAYDWVAMMDSTAARLERALAP